MATAKDIVGLMDDAHLASLHGNAPALFQAGRLLADAYWHKSGGLPAQELIFSSVLHISRQLGRMNALRDANSLLLQVDEVTSAAAEKEVSKTRSDIVASALERGSTEYAVMLLVLSRNPVKGPAVTACQSLFTLIDRLVEVGASVESFAHPKHQPLAWAGALLVTDAGQTSALGRYGLFIQENAEALVHGHLQIPAERRQQALTNLQDMETRYLPPREIEAAFARLSGMGAPRTQFYDVVFGSGDPQAATPRVKHASSFVP